MPMMHSESSFLKQVQVYSKFILGYLVKFFQGSSSKNLLELPCFSDRNRYVIHTQVDELAISLFNDMHEVIYKQDTYQQDILLSVDTHTRRRYVVVCNWEKSTRTKCVLLFILLLDNNSLLRSSLFTRHCASCLPAGMMFTVYLQSNVLKNIRMITFSNIPKGLSRLS